MEASITNELLTRYQAGCCTPAEEQLIEEWYASFDEWPPYFENVNSVSAIELTARTRASIQYAIAKKIQQPKSTIVRKIITYSSVAAAMFILLTAGYYWILLKSSVELKKDLVEKASALIDSASITPGANKAVLTLADGTVIDLDKAANGTLATEAGITVSKHADGHLEYQHAHSPVLSGAGGTPDNSPAYNILSTPKGGQYQITLPDGSKVWLNAASSIKYPTVFKGNERRVDITGEVYFEVAYDRNRPFIVSKGSTTVQVLGTHFNVNAYDDESSLKVTLLEGSVRVGCRQWAEGREQKAERKEESVILKPGEQVSISRSSPARPNGRSDGQLSQPIPVQTDAIMAWKNGLFQFNNVTIETVMKQAARWYDVQVVYQRDVSQDLFHGKIYRNADISQLLKILELSGAHFKIEGKKIIVQ